MYSNVRDTSLCLGRGGYLMFNSFLALLIVFLRRHPQQIPPGCRFLFHSGLWVNGRELVRMELKRRKSAATEPLCSSSSSFQPSTRRAFLVLEFLLLFYSDCFLVARHVNAWS